MSFFVSYPIYEIYREQDRTDMFEMENVPSWFVMSPKDRLGIKIFA